MPYRLHEAARQIISPGGTVTAEVHGLGTPEGRRDAETMVRALNAREAGPSLAEVQLADIESALRDARARMRNAERERMRGLAIGALAHAAIQLETARAEQATVLALQELLANRNS